MKQHWFWTKKRLHARCCKPEFSKTSPTTYAIKWAVEIFQNAPILHHWRLYQINTLGIFPTYFIRHCSKKKWLGKLRCDPRPRSKRRNHQRLQRRMSVKAARPEEVQSQTSGQATCSSLEVKRMEMGQGCLHPGQLPLTQTWGTRLPWGRRSWEGGWAPHGAPSASPSLQRSPDFSLPK